MTYTRQNLREKLSRLHWTTAFAGLDPMEGYNSFVDVCANMCSKSTMYYHPRNSIINTRMGAVLGQVRHVWFKSVLPNFWFKLTTRLGPYFSKVATYSYPERLAIAYTSKMPFVE